MGWGSISLIVYLVAYFASETSGTYRETTLFVWTCVLTGAAMFLLGAVKSIFTSEKWFVAGTFVLLNGAVAGIAGFLVGLVLGGLVDIKSNCTSRIMLYETM
jgi:VIT1/CCC1 family predicted Fe2+/Mn2+ transporter